MTISFLPWFRLTDSFRYSDHIYIVMTLQKLVHLHDGSDSDMDDMNSFDGTKSGRGRFSRAYHKIFSRSSSKNQYEDKQRTANTITGISGPNGYVTGHTDGATGVPMQKLRTIQRYHGGTNQERMAFMEEKSPLTKKGWAVSAEQVSIFLTAGMLGVI